MQRSFLLRAAAVLAITVLAACDAPATLPETTPFETGARRGEAPYFTVSNSGGYPLLSWTPPEGAVSYTVTYQRFWQTANRYTMEFTFQPSSTVLGSTTGSSFLDTAHAYTGQSVCSGYVSYPYGTFSDSHYYHVTATFADGTTSLAAASAPIGPC